MVWSNELTPIFVSDQGYHFRMLFKYNVSGYGLKIRIKTTVQYNGLML
jgi:hypothetical protein